MLSTLARSVQSSGNRTITSLPAIRRYATSEGGPESHFKQEAPAKEPQSQAQDSKVQQKSAAKTQAQLDEELRQKMMGISGDGGDAGIEYEDGQPVSMKRSVKNNMFRYI